MYPPTLHKYNEKQSSFPSNIFIDYMDVAKEILVFQGRKTNHIYIISFREKMSYLFNQCEEFIKHYLKSFVISQSNQY